MKTTKYRIQGITPLIHHSERLANAFDPLTRELKQLTARRKKTDDDLLDIARVEWMGGLYHDEQGIFVPAYNVFAALRDGAKLRKLGTAVKRGLLIEEDRLPLEFDGPDDPAQLFNDKRFVDMRNVKVGMSKVMRCRPIFHEWALSFTVLYDESQLQKSDIDTIVRDTGAMIGLLDYRPRFGRFEVLQ